MKKLLLLAVVAVAAMTTSCKKEYQCCWYQDGEKIEEIAGVNVCATVEAKKSEIEDIESGANNVYGDNWEYKCEEE